MSYFQRHLKSNDITEGRPQPIQILQPYPLRNKKSNQPRIKTEYNIQNQKKSKRKDENYARWPLEPTQRNRNESRPSIKPQTRFATQGPTSAEQTEQPMKAIFKEADNSMEEMLNSSMNHFQKFLRSRDQVSEENSHLLEQNEQLRCALDELMSMLRGKLDKALRKQEQQLKGVMSDYLQLITKLLADKEQLTCSLQKSEEELNKAQKRIENYESQLKQLQKKQEKYSQKQMKANAKNDQTNEVKIDEESMSLLQKIANQQNQIQTLCKCLQRVENDKNTLQQLVARQKKGDEKYKWLEETFHAKVMQLQKEHEEEFVEYQRAMREAIAKKDETIDRLSRLVGRLGSQSQTDIELFNKN